jgi:hypothetical protein
MKVKAKRGIEPHEPGQPVIGPEQLEQECEVALRVWRRLQTRQPRARMKEHGRKRPGRPLPARVS